MTKGELKLKAMLDGLFLAINPNAVPEELKALLKKAKRGDTRAAILTLAALDAAVNRQPEKCCRCGRALDHDDAGRNPWPLESEDLSCCVMCDRKQVIPARLARIVRKG